MTENAVQTIIEKFDGINERLDLIDNRFNLFETSFNKKIDSLEDKMNDRFILLEAKFITRLEKDIGHLAEATSKSFAEQDRKIESIRNELKDQMNLGFSLVDHKITSLQGFYTSKGAWFS